MSEQQNPYITIIENFNDEIAEGIKHLVATAGVDPYDIEDQLISQEEAIQELKEKGYRILEVRDPKDIKNAYVFMFQKNKFIAGVNVFLEITDNDAEIKRRMVGEKDVPKSLLDSLSQFRKMI